MALERCGVQILAWCFHFHVASDGSIDLYRVVGPHASFHIRGFVECDDRESQLGTEGRNEDVQWLPNRSLCLPDMIFELLLAVRSES
ncbi:hypothetical protein AC792_03075 [Arthrobacter sp. RIT-PI-e]|nr:hypothetical protein AC792_03075 [Arthrobacter sp. RIT-PI-e]